MSDKAAGQKARSPEGWDEKGPAAGLPLSYVSIQICSFLSPVRLGPPCRRPILIATPLPQSLTWCTSRSTFRPEALRRRQAWTFPGNYLGTNSFPKCIGLLYLAKIL